MSEKNKNIRSFLIVIIFIVLMVVGSKLIDPNKNPKENTENTQEEVVLATNSSCGMTIIKPEILWEATNTVEIEAIVDNREMQTLGCAWGVFEANAGTVIATDQNGIVIGQTYLSTSEEWMTVNPVNYTAKLELDVIPENEMTLIFEEDNSADMPNPDTLILKIQIK